jgi:hypothetical protein
MELGGWRYGKQDLAVRPSMKTALNLNFIHEKSKIGKSVGRLKFIKIDKPVGNTSLSVCIISKPF